MIPVRQSTAVEISIGPVLDADGVAFTGAVVGDFQVKKNSADWAALNGSATATHTAVGNYDLVLTTSDVDTVGIAAIRISDTVNACATIYLQVIEEVIYDALYAASANTFTGAAGSNAVRLVDLVTTTTTATNLTNAPTSGDLTATMKTSVGTAVAASAVASVTGNVGGNVTGSVGSVLGGINTSAGTITTLDALDTAQDSQHSTTQGKADSILSKLLKYFQLLFRSDAAIATDNATELTAINADGGSGAGDYDNADAAVEALRDRGDVAWVTATGFSTLDAAGVRTAVGLASANLDTQLADIPTVSEFEARTLAASAYFDFTTDSVVVGTNNDKTGYSISGTLTTLDALDTAQDTQHGTTQTYLTNNLGTAGAAATEAGGTGDHLTALATQTSVNDVPTNAELASAITTGLTTALTEGYRSTGATGSVRDLLYELLAHIGEFSISSTTKTTKKLDGSTTAKTYTLDDATSPTSITEAT